jgi:hypothetical protein
MNSQQARLVGRDNGQSANAGRPVHAAAPGSRSHDAPRSLPSLSLPQARLPTSSFVGEHTDAHGHRGHPHDQCGRRFANEYRAERAGAALHDNVRHQAVAVRSGIAGSIDVRPGPFMQSVRAGLHRRGISDDQIRYEVFGSGQWRATPKRDRPIATTA